MKSILRGMLSCNLYKKNCLKLFFLISIERNLLCVGDIRIATSSSGICHKKARKPRLETMTWETSKNSFPASPTPSLCAAWCGYGPCILPQHSGDISSPFFFLLKMCADHQNREADFV